jgi:hypothetical protein
LLDYDDLKLPDVSKMFFPKEKPWKPTDTFEINESGPIHVRFGGSASVKKGVSFKLGLAGNPFSMIILRYDHASSPDIILLNDEYGDYEPNKYGSIEVFEFLAPASVEGETAILTFHWWDIYHSILSDEFYITLNFLN